MAATRYGRIYHSDHFYINLRFASADERKAFTEKFNAYHASHDHDGEAPRFENEVASKIGNPESTTIHDAHSVSIDGYATYEIEEYHNPDISRAWRGRYKPPTCCVAPVISIDRTFLQSDILERHELSAIFTDMPEQDYASLLESVEKDGFMDPVIRLIGREVLDGWHRYRAAKELNLLRKLRFQQWIEKDEGDPAAFVYARNRVRRHLDKSRQAQITVYFNERYELGRNQYSDEGSSNDEPKTRQKLAAEAGVSTATIDRAIAIEKEGESEAVISGEKTAGEVIKARDAATAKKRKKQVLKNLWDIRKQASEDYIGESGTDLTHLTLPDLEKGFVKHNKSYAEAFESGMQRIDAAVSFNHFQDRAFEVDEHGNAKVDVSDLEEEYRAISTYAGDLRQWKRPNWSPDTNWILPLIEAKKSEASHHDDSDRMTSDKAKSVTAEEAEQMVKDYPKSLDEAVASDDDLKTLREQVKAQMPKYKQWYDNEGYKEGDLVSRASFSQFIHALHAYRETEQGGAATVEELKDLLGLLKQKSYPFAHKLREIVRPEQAESEGLGEKTQQLRLEIREYLPKWRQDNPGNEDATLFVLLDARFRLEYGIQRGTGPFFFEEVETLLGLMKANDLALADKVREILGTGSGINSTAETDESDTDPSMDDRMDRCRADLLEVWQQNWDWEGLEVLLYVEEYGITPTVITEMQKEIAAAHPKPEPTSPTDAGCEVIDDESDEDTSLAEIDNLPAVKHFLESLLHQVGTIEDRILNDNLACAIYDALLLDDGDALTERQQLAILIDVAYTLVSESM